MFMFMGKKIMPKESDLIKIIEGNKLVYLQLHYPDASAPAPTVFEQEIVRIFHEHRKFRLYLKGHFLKTCEKHCKVRCDAYIDNKIAEILEDIP